MRKREKIEEQEIQVCAQTPSWQEKNILDINAK
jgi:hypothetical protein